jgi:hypothetical protein
MREIRELSPIELDGISGGLLQEISQGVKALADAAADALAVGAMRQGCLMNTDGSFTACPKNPPPI